MSTSLGEVVVVVAGGAVVEGTAPAGAGAGGAVDAVGVPFPAGVVESVSEVVFVVPPPPPPPPELAVAVPPPPPPDEPAVGASGALPLAASSAAAAGACSAGVAGALGSSPPSSAGAAVVVVVGAESLASVRLPLASFFSSAGSTAAITTT